MSQEEFENVDNDIYKKWYRTKDKSGFIALNGWLDAGKVSIDIGEIIGGNLNSATKVYTNALEFNTFLDAIKRGVAKDLFPAKGNDNPTAESYVAYGGAKFDGKPVSRILKVHHWQSGKDSNGNIKYDDRSFAFKCGHFYAKETSSGAFIPDMSKGAISMNLIKMNRRELHEMAIRMDIAVYAFAAANPKTYLQSYNGATTK